MDRLFRIAAFTSVIATFAPTARATARESAARAGFPIPLIVERMGREMSEADVRHAIAFRPFAPARRVVAAALLPPFRGSDVRAHRGIGLEYADARGRLYALAQWPANGGTIDQFPALNVPNSACRSARSFYRGTRPSGIVWSTPHGLIMTLAPDGENDARTLQTEWEKLIQRGACR